MKIKSGYLLREVAGNNVVIPLGDEVVNFNGVMTLSGSAAFLWRRLEGGAANEKELVDAILGEYDIDESTAAADVGDFISALSSKGLLE